MPVLAAIRERFARELPLDGRRVAACLHVTAETANLVRALRAGGAQVGLCAANPLSTQDDVAAALVAEHGAEVLGVRGEDRAAYERHLGALIERAPQILIDDGAELIVCAHRDGGAVAAGVARRHRGDDDRARAAARDGCPGNAALPGAGDQRDAHRACLQRPLRHRTVDARRDPAGDEPAARRPRRRGARIRLGGRGVAQRAKGAGAAVIVCEVDAVRALEARMEGFEVMSALAAAPLGEVFITVTGAPDVLRREHFELMRDGAVLANAGHFDVEISLAELAAIASGPAARGAAAGRRV